MFHNAGRKVCFVVNGSSERQERCFPFPRMVTDLLKTRVRHLGTESLKKVSVEMVHAMMSA